MKRLFNHHVKQAGLACLLLTFFTAAQTQNKVPDGSAERPDQKQATEALQERLEGYDQSRQSRVSSYLEKNEVPKREVMEDGTTRELIDVRNGRPLYYQTRGLGAAITVSTDSVWPGYGLFNLNGSGDSLGLWDGGAVYAAHQEFGMPNRVNQKDVPAGNDQHATAVASVMIAAGINANAKGMAFAANAHAYDWVGDLAEMNTAAQNGLKISNHSYGYDGGWYWNFRGDGLYTWLGDTNLSKVYDSGFGYYDSLSYYHDTIANANPEYLMVIAAGNERNHNAPAPGTFFWVWDVGGWALVNYFTPNNDGNYDCIYRGNAISKNVLTVGACDNIPTHYTQPSDVSMLTYSSYGPTDDGRIKPDLVASGDSLYVADSLHNNTSYRWFQGTSAAAPSVTGSLGLLQNYYRSTHSSSHMKSATLKAVAIHTVDAADTIFRPAYSYGWGLLNTKKAAQLIQADSASPDRIQELTLTQGQTQRQMVYCDGSEPLRVTIAWNDPAGPVHAEALNNRTANLINDLDLSVVSMHSTSPLQTHYPFSLDPNNPSAVATTNSTNDVDNVEYVYISIPTPGFYSINVGHKNTLLGGSQDYALIISGTSNQCTMTSLQGTTPTFGDVGDTVSFPGYNFNPLVSQYSNKFGATAGTLAGLTSTPALQFTVNAGATYEAPIITHTGCAMSLFGPTPIRQTFDCGGTIDSLTFLGHEDFAADSTPHGLALSDLNDDGYAEVIIANNGSNTFTVFQNAAAGPGIHSGSFSSSTNFICQANPEDIQVQDLDGDGKPDVVTVHEGLDSVCVRLNTTATSGGAVTFSPRYCISTPTGASPVRAAITDVDMDGKPDIITANSGTIAPFVGGSISVFKNVHITGSVGAQSFKTPVSFALSGMNPDYPKDIAVADLDGDFQPEVITANAGMNAITVFQNQCNQRGVISTGTGGSLPTYQVAGSYGTPGLHVAIAVGDANSDGKLDLAVVEEGSGLVSVFSNASTLGTPAITTVPETPRTVGTIGFTSLTNLNGGNNPLDMTFCNLNGDASPDLVILNHGDSTIRSFENDGSGTFLTEVIDSVHHQSIRLAVGDLDNDNKPEVTVTNLLGNDFSVFENQILPPRPTFALISPDSVCDGNMVMVQSTHATAANFHWYLDNGLDMSDPSGMYAATEDGDYTLVVEDTNGCLIPALDTTHITVFPLPTVDAGPDDTLYVDNDSVTFTGFSPTGGTWTGDTLVDSAGNYLPAVPGVHTLYYEYIDSNGCFNMDDKVVIVLDSADAGITNIFTNYFECLGSDEDIQVELKNFSNSPLLSADIEWEVNDTAETTYHWTGLLTSGATTTVNIGDRNINVGGIYTIEAWTVDPNDTTDQDHSNDTTIAGPQEFCDDGNKTGPMAMHPSNEPSILGWHNSVSNTLTVEMTFESEEAATVRLLDLQGQVVNTRQVRTADGHAVFTFNTSTLSAGIYLCSVTHSAGTYTMVIPIF